MEKEVKDGRKERWKEEGGRGGEVEGGREGVRAGPTQYTPEVHNAYQGTLLLALFVSTTACLFLARTFAGRLHFVLQRLSLLPAPFLLLDSILLLLFGGEGLSDDEEAV